jgi:hypothetical protein
MRALWILLLTLGFFVTAHAATGRVVKVLPFFLDQQGQIAKSPSLFDRDAYQAELRDHPEMISGIRYKVLWSARHADGAALKLRVELRGTGTNGLPNFKSLETGVKPGFFSKWEELTIAGGEYQAFKSVTAWRATLWDGNRLLGEQKSFLW